MTSPIDIRKLRAEGSLWGNAIPNDPTRLDREGGRKGDREGGPIVLLAATCLWSCTPKLAIALARAGCTVMSLSPRRHLLNKTRAVSARRFYRATRPLHALAGAIEAFKPDLIIACDERVVEHMHRLHAGADENVRALIERSLGAPSGFGVTLARNEVLALAVDQGISVPETREVQSPADLAQWAEAHPFPWVLKADGSWGGEGVKIVASREEAERAFRKLTRPIDWIFGLRQLALRQDLFSLTPWMHRPPRRLMVQRYVQGRPGNCAIGAWEGASGAGLAVEVIKWDGKTGPASVIRVTDDPRMLDAGAKIIAALKLSGFVGFDFLIEAGTGTPWLLEMNPRATPICHLNLGPGRAMVAALLEQLTGRPQRPSAPDTAGSIIGLYPQAEEAVRDDEALRDVYIDAPCEDKELVRAMAKPAFIDRRKIANALERFGLRKAALALRA